MDLRLGKLNSIQLLGRLCSNGEIKYTPSGSAVFTFRIAVDDSWYNQEKKEWIDRSYFFSVTTWGKAAEPLSQRIHKGSPVLVEGKLTSRSWESKSGEKRYAVDVVSHRVQSLERKPKEDGAGDAGNPAGAGAPAGGEEPDIPKDQLDDIPF